MSKQNELKNRIENAVTRTLTNSIHPAVASDMITEAIWEIGCTYSDVKAAAIDLEKEHKGAESFVLSFVH